MPNSGKNVDDAVDRLKGLLKQIEVDETSDKSTDKMVRAVTDDEILPEGIDYKRRLPNR